MRNSTSCQFALSSNHLIRISCMFCFSFHHHMAIIWSRANELNTTIPKRAWSRTQEAKPIQYAFFLIRTAWNPTTKKRSFAWWIISFLLFSFSKQPQVFWSSPTFRKDYTGIHNYDGNGAGSDRVKSMRTRTRNPKSKPKTEPPSPKLNPRIPEIRFLCQHNNSNNGFL